jgi:hypothetical protein
MLLNYLPRVKNHILRRISFNSFSMSAKEKLQAKKESRFALSKEENYISKNQSYIRNIGTIAHIGK